MIRLALGAAVVVARVAVLAVIGTGLAYVLYFRLIGDLGATTAATVNYLVPVFAVLFGVMLLGEPLTWHMVVGGFTVTAAIGYDQWRRRTTPRRYAPPWSRASRTAAPCLP